MFFTTVCAQYQVLRATQLWGPYGRHWGLKDFKWTEVSKGDTVVEVALEATFWYPEGEFPIASDMSYQPGNETRKKLRTDLQSKALSLLGFSADIFMGAFDGNRYDGIGKDVGKAIGAPRRAYDKKSSKTPPKPKAKPKPPVQEQLEETFDATEINDDENPFDHDPEMNEDTQPQKLKFKLVPEKDRISAGQVKFLWVLNNWGLERGDKEGKEEAKTELNLYVQSMGWGQVEMIPWKSFRKVYEQIPRWNPNAAEKIAEVCEEDDERRAKKKK